jgi:hypothetical protein
MGFPPVRRPSGLGSPRWQVARETPNDVRQEKKSAQACDELIDKGAIIHRRIVGLYAPELVEFIQ